MSEMNDYTLDTGWQRCLRNMELRRQSECPPVIPIEKSLVRLMSCDPPKPREENSKAEIALMHLSQGYYMLQGHDALLDYTSRKIFIAFSYLTPGISEEERIMLDEMDKEAERIYEEESSRPFKNRRRYGI